MAAGFGRCSALRQRLIRDEVKLGEVGDSPASQLRACSGAMVVVCEKRFENRPRQAHVQIFTLNGKVLIFTQSTSLIRCPSNIGVNLHRHNLLLFRRSAHRHSNLHSRAARCLHARQVDNKWDDESSPSIDRNPHTSNRTCRPTTRR